MDDNAKDMAKALEDAFSDENFTKYFDSKPKRGSTKPPIKGNKAKRKAQKKARRRNRG